MTTKLGVLAKVLSLVVLLAAPAAAQNHALRRSGAPRSRRAPAVRRVLPPSHASVPGRELRVCAAKRAEEKATPSIEPEWPSSPAPRAELLAKR